VIHVASRSDFTSFFGRDNPAVAVGVRARDRSASDRGLNGGQSVPAAQQFPIQDDAAADSGADGQDDDMGFTAGRAQPDLRPRGGVGVVSHDDRQPEPVAPRLTQMFVAPGKVRCEEDGRAAFVDEPRRAKADSYQGIGTDQFPDGIARLFTTFASSVHDG